MMLLRVSSRHSSYGSGGAVLCLALSNIAQAVSLILPGSSTTNSDVPSPTNHFTLRCKSHAIPPSMLVQKASANHNDNDDDDNNNNTPHHDPTHRFSSGRREFLVTGTTVLPLVLSSWFFLLMGGAGGGGGVVGSAVANAAVTDETDTFGDNWWTKGSSPSSPFTIDTSRTPSKKQISSTTTTTTTPPPATLTAAAVASDEITISISKEQLLQNSQNKKGSGGGGGGGLGIELGEVEFRTNLRVIVKSITPGSLADQLGIQPNWIVIGINGQGTERTNAEGVALLVYRAMSETQPKAGSSSSSSGGDNDGDNINKSILTFQFRDPAGFRNQLVNMGPKGAAASVSTDGGTTSTNNVIVTTQVAPAGDTTRRNPDGSIVPTAGNNKNSAATTTTTAQDDQRLTVSQLVAPKLCRRGADTDDLLEISYVGTVVETGAIFDGSAVKINGDGIPGRGNDVSIFFVLGKQPYGQFPPGWDVGLYGICVGERRRLLVPPVLAYGSVGLPRRGIPPNATLQYDVTLVSLNGLAMPQ
jgi:FK506-binding protein 2